MSPPSRFIFPLPFLFTVLGCASRQCPPTAAKAGLERFHLQSSDLAAAVEARMNRKGRDARMDVLVLSGGGAYGAWGAGVLNGWRTAADKRPKFDVVTGISTGALLASFAFIDDDAGDEAMKLAYTTTNTAHVYHKKFFLAVLFGDSLYSTKPLEKMIRKYVSDDVIKKVAVAGAEGRRLYVGTVNLDDGKLRVWDMTKLAAEAEYDLYRRVILAATAIPVLFPPVEIDGAMYVDGGTRSQLFIRQRLVPIIKQIKNAQSPQARNAPESVKLHVIVNGRLGLSHVCVDDHLLGIAQRSAENLVDAGGIGDLYRTKTLANENRFDFALSFYDPKSDAVDLPTHEFIPAQMLRLYEQGEGWGRRGQWLKDVPALPEDEL